MATITCPGGGPGTSRPARIPGAPPRTADPGPQARRARRHRRGRGRPQPNPVTPAVTLAVLGAIGTAIPLASSRGRWLLVLLAILGYPFFFTWAPFPTALAFLPPNAAFRRQELPAVADPADLGGRDRMPPTSPPRLVRGLCHVRRHDPCRWTPDRGSAKPIACPEPRTSTRSASRDTGAATPVKPCIRRLRAPKPRSAPIIHRDGWGLAAQMTGRLCGQD